MTRDPTGTIIYNIYIIIIINAFSHISDILVAFLLDLGHVELLHALMNCGDLKEKLRYLSLREHLIIIWETVTDIALGFFHRD